MYIYILYAIVFTLMLLINKREKRILIPIFLLLVLNAFRNYSVGTDYSHYLAKYSLTIHDISSLFRGFTFNTFVDNIGNDSYYEYGWILFNYMGSVFDLHFYIINFIAISIVLFFTIRMVRCQSPHIYLSIYLFLMLDLFFPSFNIIRQTIAISIFCYSVRYINEGEPLLFILFCLLAAMFHSSALFLLVLYFLKYLKINSITSISLLIISIIIPILGLDEVIFSWFVNDKTLGFYTHYIADKGISGDTAMAHLQRLIMLIIQSLIFVYCSLRLKESNNIYMILWLIGLLILNFGMNYPWLYRMSGYFLIAQVIAMPMVVYKGRLGKDLVSYYIIIIYCLLFYVYKLYINADGIVPYSTIL